MTEIEYIGKESNKWEDQNHFGIFPEEEMNYGSAPVATASVFKALKAIVAAQGLRTTAKQLRISRMKLSKLLENEFAGCPTAFLQGISRIVTGINSRVNQENERNSELLRMAEAEIQEIGISEFAKRLEVNGSNLGKAIRGERALSAKMLKSLQIHVRGRRSEWPNKRP